MRLTILVAALLAAPLAHAAEILNGPKASPVIARPSGISPVCLEWTDDCRVCSARDKTLACSNIGIACLPKQWRCTSP
ncbi:MAG TPA: hypothetical protein VHD34_05705 [Xanthobacteraceae bacterium]|nr:hypothetical protein [Xanthobacteraceae bacterium]